MKRRLLVVVGIPALVLWLVGLIAIGWSATAMPASASQEASPVASPIVVSLIEIESTAQPQQVADASVARVSICIQYQTPMQSVGNPPAYGNSPIYLYWWDAPNNQWRLWLEAQTDGVGCGGFAGLVPNHSYAVRAYLKVQSPVARAGAGVIVDAWSKSFFVDSGTTNVNLGTYVLPNGAP